MREPITVPLKTFQKISYNMYSTLVKMTDKYLSHENVQLSVCLISPNSMLKLNVAAYVDSE